MVPSDSPSSIAPQASAKTAGLRYVSDAEPGIRRLGAAGKFYYLDAQGGRLHDASSLERIKRLAIPPAWRKVWVCSNSRGHLQATGRDQRGRKQYRYHPLWRATRDQTKYARLGRFAQALPQIRRCVRRDLARGGLPREKVLAALVDILDRTGERPGNENYTRDNASHGLTTLRDRHAKIRGGVIRFVYRGKSGVRREVQLWDNRLARIVRRCQELPGQVLFQYLDEQDMRRPVRSEDVNDYIAQISGPPFTAKVFRTWRGTLCAARLFCGCEPCDSDSHAKRQVAQVVSQTALSLGNRPATCRKYYIHPAVIDAYVGGRLGRYFPAGASARQGTSSTGGGAGGRNGLDAAERGLCRLLLNWERIRIKRRDGASASR